MQITTQPEKRIPKKPPLQGMKEEEQKAHFTLLLTALVASPTHDVEEKEQNEHDAKDDRHDDGRNDQQRLVAQRRPLRYH